MKAPDPSNCPQTPTSKGDPVERAGPVSLQMPNPRDRPDCAAGLDVSVEEQPDTSDIDKAIATLEAARNHQALARLEAWLSVDDRRYVRYIGKSLQHAPEWNVILQCAKYPGTGPIDATLPDFAATIHAAIDKATELKV